MSALDRLEKLAAKLGGGGGGDEESANQKVADYDVFYAAHVQPFVDTCNKLEGTKSLVSPSELHHCAPAHND